MKKILIVEWVLRVPLAILFLMMAIPKFAGNDITVLIFTTLGVEPWGRLVTGSIELAIFILVLIPATTIYGVLSSLVLILGALFAHLVILGIVVENSDGSISDGGEIFLTAIVILLLTFANLYYHRKSIPKTGSS